MKRGEFATPPSVIGWEIWVTLGLSLRCNLRLVLKLSYVWSNFRHSNQINAGFHTKKRLLGGGVVAGRVWGEKRVQWCGEGLLQSTTTSCVSGEERWGGRNSSWRKARPGPCGRAAFRLSQRACWAAKKHQGTFTGVNENNGVTYPRVLKTWDSGWSSAYFCIVRTRSQLLHTTLETVISLMVASWPEIKCTFPSPFQDTRFWPAIPWNAKCIIHGIGSSFNRHPSSPKLQRGVLLNLRGVNPVILSLLSYQNRSPTRLLRNWRPMMQANIGPTVAPGSVRSVTAPGNKSKSSMWLQNNLISFTRHMQLWETLDQLTESLKVLSSRNRL